MMSIPNNSGNPFLKGIIDRMKAVGADLGLTVVEGQNQGTPAEWCSRSSSPPATSTTSSI